MPRTYIAILIVCHTTGMTHIKNTRLCLQLVVYCTNDAACWWPGWGGVPPHPEDGRNYRPKQIELIEIINKIIIVLYSWLFILLYLILYYFTLLFKVTISTEILWFLILWSDCDTFTRNYNCIHASQTSPWRWPEYWPKHVVKNIINKITA